MRALLRAPRYWLAALCALLLVCCAAAPDSARGSAHDADALRARHEQRRVDGVAALLATRLSSRALRSVPQAPAAHVSATGASVLPPGDASLPKCALVIHFHVLRTGGSLLRELMAVSAERGGGWEAVPAADFRTRWPLLRNAVLGGPTASCDADWARRCVARAACAGGGAAGAAPRATCQPTGAR